MPVRRRAGRRRGIGPGTIQRPDLIHRLQTFSGLRQGSIAPQLGDTVLPVLVVGDVSSHRSPGLVEGMPTAVMGCGFYVLQPAVAGQYSIVQLRNPPLSSRIVRVRAIKALSVGGFGVMVSLLFLPAGDFATAVPTTTLDTRFRRMTGAGTPLVPPTAIVSRGSQAVNPASTTAPIYYSENPGGLPPQVQLDAFESSGMPVTLDEGDALLVFPAVVNDGLALSLWWDEEPKARA